VNARLVQGGVVLGVFGCVFVGAIFLADTMLSRHDDVPEGSELVVELLINTHAAVEAGTEEIAEALIVTCQLEVRGNVVPDSMETVGDHRYRFVIRPALDRTDRHQLRGCLQDLRIDGVLADVVSMELR
jgi:hypothetical protein